MSMGSGAGNDRSRHRIASESQERAADEEAHRRSTAEQGAPPDDDLARLSLVNEAIWVLVSRRLGIDGDELRTAVDELRAARDRDGAPHPRPCPACGSMVPVDRATCQFCGVDVPGRRLFT